MKTITLASLFILVLAGCTQDINSLNKEECIKRGYKHAIEKKLNYRTGKYEMKIICLNKIK